MNCPKCGRPAIEAKIPSGHQQLFDEKPHPTEGQALIFAGEAVFIQGPALFDAHRHGLPTYQRHAVHCPSYWKTT